MVYKLYLKDKYGKKTLLAKSENKDLIEKAKHEYDTKDEVPFEYKLLYWVGIALLYIATGYINKNYSAVDYFMLITIMFLIVSLFAFVIFFSNNDQSDGKTFIVWED